MADCCAQSRDAAGKSCPGCGGPGREVDRTTLKALLQPRALAQLGPGPYRFCPTPACPTVYFGPGESHGREDLVVPVFQKEREGHRTVCYCFAVSEAVVREEAEATGASAAASRIRALVQAGRCACELRNPQGSCCLGDVFAIVAQAQRTGSSVA